MIKTIIFDISGVITEDLPSANAGRIAKKFSLPFDTVWETVYVRNYYLGRDGEISAEEQLKRSVEELGISVTHEEFEKEYMQAYPIREDMVEILEKLSEKYTLCILSNQTHINTNNLHPILDPFFTKVIFSNEVGYHKPEQEIYNLLFHNTDIKPNECVFVDDTPKCLLPAKGMGIKTILFKNKDQLLDDLGKLGVKVE